MEVRSVAVSWLWAHMYIRPRDSPLLLVHGEDIGQMKGILAEGLKMYFLENVPQ